MARADRRHPRPARGHARDRACPHRRLLYRRGTFAGTLDDLICDALLAQRDAEIALSPGFRWGGTLIAGEAVTWEDVYNATAITYPAAYRIAHDGRDHQADPGGGGRQSRSTPIPTCSRAATWCGSAAWATPSTSMRAMGSRITQLHLLGSGAPIEAEQGVRRGGLGLGQRRPSRARRSGRSSPRISSAASCSRRSSANRSRSCAPAAERPAAPLTGGPGTPPELASPRTTRHAHTSLHPSRRGAGGPRELPVAVRAAAGAALSGLPRRHHHRADDGARAASTITSGGAWCWPRVLLRAGLHHRVRGARRRRLRARASGCRRTRASSRSSPASSSSASACTSSGCCACRCSIAQARFHTRVRGREPGRRLRHGARVRLRLDALHRSGAGDRADAGGQRGEPRRRRAPAARLLARARHSLHPGGGGDRSVHRLPAALPAASGPGRDGDGRCCWS